MVSESGILKPNIDKWLELGLRLDIEGVYRTWQIQIYAAF